MIQLEDHITPEEYMDLRSQAGWMQLPPEEARICVENAYLVLCVRDEGKAVGVARLLWDGGYVAFLSDVLVSPPYQGRGIGRKLVEAVIKDQGRYETGLQSETDAEFRQRQRAFL